MSNSQKFSTWKFAKEAVNGNSEIRSGVLEMIGGVTILFSMSQMELTRTGSGIAEVIGLTATAGLLAANGLDTWAKGLNALPLPEQTQETPETD